MTPTELNLAVAEKVLRFHVVKVRPEWYQGREVWLFYLNQTSTLIAYSWDANACNAIMYRNGKDDSDGSADTLPWYVGDLESAWTVVETIRAAGKLEAFKAGLPDIWGLDQEAAATAICQAALEAVGGVE